MQAPSCLFITLISMFQLVAAAEIPDLPRITPTLADLAPSGILKRDQTGVTTSVTGWTWYSTITDPTLYASITNQSAFIGFSFWSKSTVATYCTDSSQWSSWGTQNTWYGQCCKPLEGCNMNTGCSGSTLLPVTTQTISPIVCIDPQPCTAIPLLAALEDTSTTYIYACWPTTTDIKYIRSINITSSSVSSVSATTTPSLTLPTLASSLIVPTQAASSSSAPSSQSSISKAWIAGPVLGGVLGLFILAGLGAFLYKRGQRSQRLSQATAYGPVMVREDTQDMHRSWHASPSSAEMDSEPRAPLSELPGEGEYVNRR